jgi:hypothetical protein
MEQFLDLVSPFPVRSGGKRAPSSAPVIARTLEGARLGLVDNGKANAAEVLEELRDLLQERCGVVPGITVRKPVNGPLDQAGLDALQENADIVLVASAD